MTFIKSIKNNDIKLYLVLPLLYTIELILGFGGNLIIVFGLPIRTILFALSFLSLYYGWFIETKNQGYTFFKKEKNILKTFSILDWALVFFLVINFIWATIIPLIFGGSIKLSIKEMDGMSTLLFFFPLSFFMKKCNINWNNYKKLVFVLIMTLALFHCILYFGDLTHQFFIEKVFNWILTLLGGTGVAPNIIRGNGYVRVIFPCTVLLLLGFYLIFSKFKKISILNLISYGVLLFALLCSITKSLMLGILIAAVFLFIYMILVVRKKTSTKNTILVGIFTLIFVFLANQYVFGDLIFQRMSNVYVTSMTNVETTDLTSVQLDELEGSVEGNLIRIEQIKDLTEKFKEKPLTGHGYGSYVEHNIRGVKGHEYLYEVFLPALLMKIGVLGFVSWLIFGALILFYLFKNISYRNAQIPIILFGFLGMSVIIQTNPLLLSFSGMYIICFLLLEIQWLVSRHKNKTSTKSID